MGTARTDGTRALWAIVVAALAVACIGSGCSRGGSTPESGDASTPAAGAAAVTIRSAGGSVNGQVYGPTSGRGVVVITGPNETDAWATLATELGQLGYRVLVFAPPERAAAGAARAAADLLRGQGVEKIVLVGSGAATATALEAARDGADGVAVLNPAAGADPIPNGGMPAVPVLALGSLADAPSSALARRIYDAAAEPRTLALYPSRAAAPGVFGAAESAELKSVFLDFLRSAFEPLSA